MPYLERDGARLFYEECGTGKPVVLHHALTADRTGWIRNGTVEGLIAIGHRCILIDGIGHGESSDAASAHRISLHQRVSDVIAVADALSLRSFAFVGYSMGAWIGTGLVERHADRLDGAVLAGWDPIMGARLFTALTDRDDRRREFAQIVRKLVGDIPMHRTRLEGYEETYLRLFCEIPSLETLGSVDIPLALMCGREDPYYANAQQASKLIGARFCELPGDHIQAFVAGRFGELVAEWAAGVPDESAPSAAR